MSVCLFLRFCSLRVRCRRLMCRPGEIIHIMWSALAWRWCAVMLTGSQRYAFCNDRFHNRKITRLRNNFMPNILPTDLCANTPPLAIHD
ncbi:hypothetical protein DBO95_27575, partial [Yersinia pestis]